MTVCVAALCQVGLNPEHPEWTPFIVGATDRKLTSGIIEYEPKQGKWFTFSAENSLPRMAALIAGQISPQIEVCTKVEFAQPNTVEGAVATYCRELATYNLRESERSVLAKYGLNMKSFLRRQRSMSRDFVEQTTEAIRESQAEVETIVCGVDKFGHQIYTINKDGSSRWDNPIGFTAIGHGAYHAESQFMFSKYTPKESLAKALLLVYLAKKHAETAPSVGKETELFMITDRFLPLRSDLTDELEKIHQQLKQAQDNAVVEAGGLTERFLRQLLTPDHPLASPPVDRTAGSVPKSKPKRPKRK